MIVFFFTRKSGIFPHHLESKMMSSNARLDCKPGKVGDFPGAQDP